MCRGTIITQRSGFASRRFWPAAGHAFAGARRASAGKNVPCDGRRRPGNVTREIGAGPLALERRSACWLRGSRPAPTTRGSPGAETLLETYGLRPFGLKGFHGGQQFAGRCGFEHNGVDLEGEVTRLGFGSEGAAVDYQATAIGCLPQELG